MYYLVLFLLVASAHFNLTPFAPTQEGKAWIGWPFAADSKSWLGMSVSLPAQSGSFITPTLAGVAGICFLAAAACLLGWLVPVDWFRPLVIAACSASVLLYALYFGPLALLPLALDVFLLYGLFGLNWSVAGLK